MKGWEIVFPTIDTRTKHWSCELESFKKGFLLKEFQSRGRLSIYALDSGVVIPSVITMSAVQYSAAPEALSAGPVSS